MPPEHDRYNIKISLFIKNHLFMYMPCHFVLFSLHTSFCRDAVVQAHPFCRKKIVSLYNLWGRDPTRVISRGILPNKPLQNQYSAKIIFKLPSRNLSYKMWSLLSCQPSTRAKSLHFDALKQYPAPFTL